MANPFITSISIDKIDFHLQLFGNDFVLLKSPKVKNLGILGKAIFDKNFSFIEEVIATETEVYIKLNDHFTIKDLSDFSTIRLVSIEKKQAFKLPIFFDHHQDWDNILTTHNLSKAEFIKDLCQQHYTVAMFGFLPGFVYLNGLPSHLHIARKANPSLRIPPNSLAIGGKYLGIYSLPSPGGWYVLGKLATAILDLKELPPISLSVEHPLIIEAINERTYLHLTKTKTTFKDYNGLS